MYSAVNCKPYDPPINGLIACSHSDLWGGDACTPQCNNLKEFARIPASFYICQASGNWYIWDFRPTVSREMPWPDCTGKHPVRQYSHWNVPVMDLCMVGINLEKLAWRQNSECCKADFSPVRRLDRAKFGLYRFQSFLFVVVIVISILLKSAFWQTSIHNQSLVKML